MTSVRNFIKAVSGTLPSAGRVVSATETTLSVATRTGVVVVPKEKASLYGVGDEVKIVNGVIAGKKKDTSSLPVYYV